MAEQKTGAAKHSIDYRESRQKQSRETKDKEVYL